MSSQYNVEHVTFREKKKTLYLLSRRTLNDEWQIPSSFSLDIVNLGLQYEYNNQRQKPEETVV